MNIYKNFKQKLIRWLRRKLENEQFWLDFLIHDMEISLWEMANDLYNKRTTWEEYIKFHKLVRLYKKCLKEGLNEFSWEYLGQNGFLSQHDEEIFKEEIGDKDIGYRK